jgi:hypothetical protein
MNKTFCEEMQRWQKAQVMGRIAGIESWGKRCRDGKLIEEMQGWKVDRRDAGKKVHLSAVLYNKKRYKNIRLFWKYWKYCTAYFNKIFAVHPVHSPPP